CPLRHFGAATAGRARDAARRAADQADRTLRTSGGAEGLRQRLPVAAVLAAAVAVVVLLPLAISDYHQLQAAGVATFFVAIVGLNILTGYTGQISLGHGAFMAIGGYTTAILVHDHGWNLFAT